MSTELRDVPNTDVSQTRFWGGSVRGVCIQITNSKHYPDNHGNYFDYIQLTRFQAGQVAAELLLFAAEQEIVVDEE